jgi:hypothetical protein
MNSSSKDRICNRIGSTDNSNSYTTLMQAVERKSRRYQDDQGGFACLEALLKGSGRRRSSRTQQCRRQSRCLLERRGGRNNKHKADKCNTMHAMAICCAGCDLTYGYTIQMKGKNIRECFPVSGHLSDR